MSTTNGGPQPQMAMPQIGVLAQYVKDFSFENPHAPRSLAPSSAAAGHQHSGQRRSAPMTRDRLRGDAPARGQGRIAEAWCCSASSWFLPACSASRTCRPDSMQPVVMIECPRLLFPFAREIIATATRNGGFPPLLLNPIDFVALYRQRMAAEQRRRRRCRSIQAEIVAPDRAVAERGDETRGARRVPRPIAARQAAPGARAR